LAKSLRSEVERSRTRERFVYSLYSFSREIIAAKNLNEILNRAVKHISEDFETNVIIFLPDDSGKLIPKIKSDETILLTETEQAVATWVYNNGHSAGKGTQTLSSAAWYYLPLIIQDKTVGVIGLKTIDSGKILSSDQKQLIESFAGVVALAITKS
jgi:two-component system sensor histidine kinase KdpD